MVFRFYIKSSVMKDTPYTVVGRCIGCQGLQETRRPVFRYIDAKRCFAIVYAVVSAFDVALGLLDRHAVFRVVSHHSTVEGVHVLRAVDMRIRTPGFKPIVGMRLFPWHSRKG